MRIIAGKHKGRRIELSKEVGEGIRPTSDFAREAIFNILMHGKLGLDSHPFIDKQVLDVFCGTGAFGLEAISRGAAGVTFIDHTREAVAIARANAIKMNETDKVDFIVCDATRLGRARKKYSLVFLDPPYFSKLISPTIKSLQAEGWLEDDVLIIAEHDAKEEPPVLPEGFQVIDQRRYGRAALELVKRKSS